MSGSSPPISATIRQCTARPSRTGQSNVTVNTGWATIHYAIPTPMDNGIGGTDIAETALSHRVMNTVRVVGLT